MKNPVVQFTVFTLVFSSFASAGSTPAQTIAAYSETCWHEVKGQVSISLSQATHGATPGSVAERNAQRRQKEFDDRVADFELFKAACDDNTDGEKTFVCYAENYTKDTKSIASNRTLRGAAHDALVTTPECLYITVNESAR